MSGRYGPTRRQLALLAMVRQTGSREFDSRVSQSIERLEDLGLVDVIWGVRIAVTARPAATAGRCVIDGTKIDPEAGLACARDHQAADRRRWLVEKNRPYWEPPPSEPPPPLPDMMP
jgi:hypothetical protein